MKEASHGTFYLPNGKLLDLECGKETSVHLSAKQLFCSQMCGGSANKEGEKEDLEKKMQPGKILLLESPGPLVSLCPVIFTPSNAHTHQSYV